jgi:CheY-like chemotaxis protein/anti-sigma regulatory factor (Ser/Thr protein kinase)
METVDVRELIRGVVDSMSPTATARALYLQLASMPPVAVRGDIRRLEQVFFNLVDNALKFTPDGGRVSLDVRIIDGLVEVQVTDTGVGIEPEFLPNVFERFRQADSTISRPRGGLGLGLSIAKQLVEAHNGSVSASSAGKGSGATFTVRLPITTQRVEEVAAAQTRAAATSHAEHPETTRLDGVSVLVVDDEADARQLMAHTLQMSGATVKLADNAHDALDILEHVAMDVLLADLAMPGEDGFALIRKVRASGAPNVSAIPAAAVTAFTRDEYRQHALAAGFQLHLGKPFDPGELVRTVQQLAHPAPTSA